MQGGILLLAVTAALGLRVAKEIKGNVCHYMFFCKYVWGLGREGYLLAVLDPATVLLSSQCRI